MKYSNLSHISLLLLASSEVKVYFLSALSEEYILLFFLTGGVLIYCFFMVALYRMNNSCWLFPSIS